MGCVIPGDGWRRFVSVEPYATGANRFFVLERGETRDLRMSVRCRLPPGTASWYNEILNRDRR